MLTIKQSQLFDREVTIEATATVQPSDVTLYIIDAGTGWTTVPIKIKPKLPVKDCQRSSTGFSLSCYEINLCICEIEEIQQALGVDVDGLIGPETRNAIKQFQKERDMKETGRLTEKLVQELLGLQKTESSSPCKGDRS